MQYVINGVVRDIEEATRINGKHYIPVEAVLYTLGGITEWDNKTKTAKVTLGSNNAIVQMDNAAVTVGDKSVMLSAPPYVENDTLYVPWNFFRDVFGANSEYQGEVLTINA